MRHLELSCLLRHGHRGAVQAAGKIWRKLNQQLHPSGNGSFGESGTRIREETTPAPFLHKVTAGVVQNVSGGEISTQRPSY